MAWMALLLKSSLILGGAWAASRSLAKSSASVRHMVWNVALAAVLLLPAAGWLTPRWEVAMPAAAATATVTAPVGSSAAAPLPAGRTAFPTGMVLWGLWGAGTLVVLGRYAGATGQVRRMTRAASASPRLDHAIDESRQRLGISRAVRALESRDAPIPMTWGYRRPLVLLPNGAASWPEARLRAVLLHELVHVRRFDVLTQWLAHLACAAYWFHPLVWLASARLRLERERACDDAVLRSGLTAPDYAGHLVAVVERMRGSGAGLCAPAMADTSDLEGRVRALLDRRRDRRPVTRPAALAALVAAVAILLPLAAIQAQSQTSKGALVGIVTDASGARIPGCSVTAKNLSGSNQEAATAGVDGTYRFAAIPPGHYTLEVRSRGFKVSSQEVEVEAGKAARADVTLSIGAVSENVVVTGKRPAATPLAPASTPQRILVGGNVQATKLLNMTHPAYPERLQQLGIEGSVVMRAVISTEGSLLNLSVISTVDPDLANAALEAVRQWRYQPTLLNGQAVEVVTTITVEFRLEK